MEDNHVFTVLKRNGGPLVIWALRALTLVALSPSVYAEQSRAMGAECRRAVPSAASNRVAEEWVRQKLTAFLPGRERERALRVSSLELQAEQVKLAFYGISSTCEQYLAGSLTRDDADRSLSGYEQTINNFLHDIGNEIFLLAANAQVSDIATIRRTLGDIGATGRQAALLGEDELAEKAQQQMVRTLTEFSRTFVDRTCWEQAFSDELPFSIQRQNDILGTGIDVLPCAQRRFTAVPASWSFESCTIRGAGEWRVRWLLPTFANGDVSGSGQLSPDGAARASGQYAANWGANGVEYSASGDFALERHDTAPDEQATYTMSGDMLVKLVKGKEKIVRLEQLMGQKTKPARGPFEVSVDVSEKPCRSLD
jgi:hypothetical protein